MRVVPSVTFSTLRSPLGTFAECPHCEGEMRPEHAHYRCENCGWRDSCCD
jgi:exosome complex RNA-binding protein Csl4